LRRFGQIPLEWPILEPDATIHPLSPADFGLG
jgi:hypothetical protein